VFEDSRPIRVVLCPQILELLRRHRGLWPDAVLRAKVCRECRPHPLLLLLPVLLLSFLPLLLLLSVVLDSVIKTDQTKDEG